MFGNLSVTEPSQTVDTFQETVTQFKNKKQEKTTKAFTLHGTVDSIDI